MLVHELHDGWSYRIQRVWSTGFITRKGIDMAVVKRFGTAFLVALITGGMLAPMAAAQTASPVASPIADDEGLRVMSYNIKHAQGNDDCVDPTAAADALPEAQCAIDLPRVADVIDESGASIVGLQEVDRFWSRSGNVDQPAEFADLLGMESCYGANLDHDVDDHSDQPHQYGVTTLSAFPIIDCTNTLLPTPEGWEQRGALSTTIELSSGQQILVINTHLQAGREGEEEEATRQRTEQFEAVMEIASQSELPVIILGDLNSTPGAGELTSIEDPNSGFADVWTEIHGDEPGFTSPAGPDLEPEVRIDYIFVGAALTVLDSYVIIDESTRIAADHFPVVADLDVAQPDATPAATPVT